MPFALRTDCFIYLDGRIIRDSPDQKLLGIIPCTELAFSAYQIFKRRKSSGLDLSIVFFFK